MTTPPTKTVLNQDETQKEKKEAPPVSHGQYKVIVAILLLTFFVVGGLFAGHNIIREFDQSSFSERKISQFSDDFFKLEQRVAHLEVIAAETKDISLNQTKSPRTFENLSTYEKNIDGLTEALREIETRLNMTSQDPRLIQIKAGESAAFALAFFTLQDKAKTSDSFEKELELFSTIAPQDKKLRAQISNMKPMAQQTTPSRLVLEKEWRRLQRQLCAKIKEDNAKDWQDKIIVSLDNLISIKDAEQEDDAVLLGEQKINFPREGLQNILDSLADIPETILNEEIKSWQKKARARLNIENLLSNMAEHLISSKLTFEEDTKELKTKKNSKKKVGSAS